MRQLLSLQSSGSASDKGNIPHVLACTFLLCLVDDDTRVIGPLRDQRHTRVLAYNIEKR